MKRRGRPRSTACARKLHDMTKPENRTSSDACRPCNNFASKLRRCGIYAKEAVTTPTRAAVEKYFASGPCLICGHATYNAAHRKVDAIRDQYRAWGTFEAIAREFEVPVEIVRYIATAPIRRLDWLRRYRRKDAEARIKRELEGWEQ